MPKKIKIGLVCLVLILILLVLGIIFKDKLKNYWYGGVDSLACKGEDFYEEQVFSLGYIVHSGYVTVSGCVSFSRDTPCFFEEKIIDVYAGQEFYYPNTGKEQTVRVKLEKIENNKAYFLFSYGAAPPACETLTGCDYSCEFVKE